MTNELQTVDKTRQQTANALSTLLSTSAIVTAQDAKRVIVDALAVGKSVDNAIADSLYIVFNRGLINSVEYTDSKGKTKKCLTITDFAKTIPALREYSTPTLYELKNYGEMRSWRVYRKDEKGTVILGKIKTDKDGKPLYVRMPKVMSNGVVIKGVDGKPEMTLQYDYEPAEYKTVVKGDKTEAVTDGEPIIDLYLTAEYLKTLSLYGRTKCNFALRALGQAIGILKLHDNGKINPKMTKTDLKAIIDKLLTPIKSTPTDSESKPADSESKPADSESKPADSESKPADSESKPADSKEDRTINATISESIIKSIISMLNDLKEDYAGESLTELNHNIKVLEKLLK